MKVYHYIILITFLLILAGCSNSNNTENANNYNASASELSTNNVNSSSTNAIRLGLHEIPASQEEISSFSTKLGGKDTPRSRNIGITTSKLNETIVNEGEIFSFCDTIGNPTAEGGYEKANTFDKDGKTIQTYGGGNCQVSSTLYNAVLAVPELEVVERHEHSKEVHYVEKNKDAAVAYGSVDFKFKNNTGYKIKILSSSDLNSVNIKLIKLK